MLRPASIRSSIAGAHVRDAGSTAVEEMAYTLANGLAYVDELLRRGGDVEKFAKRLSFFFYVHMDFFEEVAKFRAGRSVLGEADEGTLWRPGRKAQHFRFGVVCGGSSLIAPQPYNNMVRVADRDDGGRPRRSAIDLHLRIRRSVPDPDRDSRLRSRSGRSRSLPIESGIARTVDPLGGAISSSSRPTGWRRRSSR